MPESAGFAIDPARTEADLATIAALFRAYAASLDVDLAYQDFRAELAGLPGKYAPPAGCLLLARARDGTPTGCVALRPLDDAGACEMKRLFVTPAGRGTGLGRRLAESVIAEARRIGHRTLCLDTLPSMATAQALYRALGFRDVAPYYDSPVPGTRFLALDLTQRQ